MTLPVYKIEVYDSVPALIHTVTSDAVEIRVKETLTSKVGTFSFTLPGEKGGAYPYNDIAVNDQVKIWLDYDSVGTTPMTIGQIYQITAPLSVVDGYQRHFAGINQGEILQRRVKTRKAWNTIGASTIVTELANDLGLGVGDIVADATAETLTTDGETYWDLLAKISDYWFSAGVQVKKDFFVDVDNDLVWKARPIRAAGVETLTVGTNINSYSVLRDATQIKNMIYTYGFREHYQPSKDGTYAELHHVQALGHTYPSTGDNWTYGGGWTAALGSVASDNTAPMIGATDLRATSDAAGDWDFYRTWADPLFPEGKEGYSTIEFWGRRYVTLTGGIHDIRVLCPDRSNYYKCQFQDPGLNAVWAWCFYNLGPKNTYNATTNPWGEWIASGSPDWDNIKGVNFYLNVGAAGSPHTFDVDGLCFSCGRYRSTASDAGSQTSYGQRDLILVDDMLTSDAECQTRAETLLYQLKDPVIRLDVCVPGNTNILIGDRLSMTIPAEGISAANYDVVTVENVLKEKPHGWRTYVTMVDSLNVREVPPATLPELLVSENRRVKQVSRGLRSIAK